MAKKQKKTKEENASERFFPVDSDDLKVTIEKKEKEKFANIKSVTQKPYKGPVSNPIEELKKTKVTSTRRKRKSPKTKNKGKQKIIKEKVREKKKKINKVAKFSAPNIALKKNGYELIITEKPQAALKIADALGTPTKRNNKGVPYYEVKKDGKNIVVACAVGHLLTLHQNTPGSIVPIFNISWVPNYLVRKADFTKKYSDTILSLAKKAGEITVATDYDVEGEVIGLNSVRYLCGQNDAKRMKFSTLTKKELIDSYENKSPTLNWGQAIAGTTRHKLDWFYGINLSRALMNAIKTTGRFKIMSIGRVQGPALNLIVNREREIQKFVPEKYFQIFITIKNGAVVELKHTKDIFDEKKLEKFKKLLNKEVTASTEKKEEKISPNAPFNLTTLQTEAYKFHSITPSATLRAAQSLYLAGLISYPRTSSQKLPNSIPYKEILEKVSNKFKANHLIKKDRPLEGKKSDPAHPSIYPTGNFQILSGDEEKIYNLIAKRFIALFCDDAIIARKKISVEVDKLRFTLTGSQIIQKNWMEIYPTKLKENEIPDIEGKVKIINVRIDEKMTLPPKRYSPASIVSALEKKNLGTKATRSSILETLYDRGYIKDTSIEATPLGISLIETLEKYSPVIIDEKLTRSFEDSMESIAQSTSGLEEKQKKVIDKAKKTITNISGDFEKNEKAIGKELIKATDELREELRKENTLNPCPTCKEGNLIINYSKKNRRYFVACDAYPKCTQTYSLPPNGVIKRTEKTCEECSWPKLMRLSKGKRPWEFCFNPKCPTNAEWIKKRGEANKKINKEQDKN